MFLKIKRFPECHIPQYNATFSCLIVKIEKSNIQNLCEIERDAKVQKKKMKLKAYPLLRHFLHLLNDMSERNKKKRCLIYHSSEEEGDDDVHEDSSDYSSRNRGSKSFKSQRVQSIFTQAA